MKGNRKKGFTLTELIVVLVIFVVLLAVAIPSAMHYIKLAEFRKNEENAKTIYMAAESALTWQRASGEWEDFRAQVMKKGILNESFKSTPSKEDKREGRIYAITLDAKAYEADSDNLVVELIDNLISDKAMLSDGTIAIEIDVESGQVYSAFYGTRRSKITYVANENTDKDTFNMNEDNREYESRRERLLGYYSVEDVTNVVNLKPTRLKVTSINLVNSETLYLTWSSNSRHDNLDVAFHIAFYETNSGEKLFELILDRGKVGDWIGEQADGSQKVRLTLKDKNGATKGDWMFPVTYENGTFKLVLDAMMSAKLQAALEQVSAQQQELRKAMDTSIIRLADVAPSLATPQTIFATIQATATYKNMGTDQAEYRQSTTVPSNSANTMYGDRTTGMTGSGETLKATIDTFRHLSNIRYYTTEKKAEFTLNSRNLDWKSVGTGLYDLKPDHTAGATPDAQKTAWKSNSDGELDFPSISQLCTNHTLKGMLGRQTISNLRLGAESVLDDTTATQTGKGKTAYIGLFCELEGIMEEVNLYNPFMTLTASETEKMAELRGVGIIAGRSSGSLDRLSITTAEPDTQIMRVEWGERSTEKDKLPAGAGGIAGVLAEKPAAGAAETLQPLPVDDSRKLENLSVAGEMDIILPTPQAVITGGTGGADGNDTAVEKEAQKYPYGAGGLFGYATLEDDVKLQKCENHANVTANLMAGGIVGHLIAKLDSSKLGLTAGMQDSEVQKVARERSCLLQCENDGLILCSDEKAHADKDRKIEGRYFGGIAGFIDHALIYDTDSASGRSSNFTYDVERKEELLKGQYVGGIAGYGVDSLLLGCETQKDGYILGSDYVGGIVGGLTDDQEQKTIGGGIGVTTNAGYVIGNQYVGGIIGKNDGNNQIQYCVNNGVAAGYEKYIGGIVGYNGGQAEVLDCASYVSDYDNSIYNMIVKNWNAVGDYVGGLVGYNNGRISFNDASQQIEVKSVASIVVGENYVGGVIGFNDVDGELAIKYTLISGRTYASGDCAGGLIGLNASQNILDHEIVVKPQSVRGENCVGGLIGANVVALDTDATMNKFRADNMLGTVTGQAFVGGLIGYQKTYTVGQLGLTNAADGTAELLAYLEKEGGADKAGLIPGLQPETNVPTDLEQSQNKNTLKITQAGNSAANLSVASNNLAIRAEVYAGGIVGYCEAGSKLSIENCKNSGNLSQASDTEFGGQAHKGVALLDYLTYLGKQQYTDAVKEIRESLAEEEDSSEEQLRSGMAGGIIGVNLDGQTIKHCANTGSMSGFTCLGGVVGFNGGEISNCELSDNMGSAALNYVGGIAGMNIGEIKECSTKAGKTVSGYSNVGGVVGYNLSGGVLTNDESKANVTAAGNYAGGVVGRNGGVIYVNNNPKNQQKPERSISGRSGKGIGGIVGINEQSGKILAKAGTAGNDGVMAITPTVSVTGRREVGGIVGINRGQLGGTEAAGTGTAPLIVCEAKLIRALETNAGGIAGSTTKDITEMVNRSWSLSADAGIAGGIVPVVSEGVTVSDCRGIGDAKSNKGYAGGIAAENHGKIIDCSVGEKERNANILITSRDAEYAGAVCAVNAATGVIYRSAPINYVGLDSDASVYGAVAGLNQGRIGDEGTTNATSISYMPDIATRASNLTIGGAAGINETVTAGANATGAVVTNVQCKIKFKENFSSYHYLGGVVGQNKENATVTNSSFDGTIQEGSGAAGNCYGGIVGENAGTVSECKVEKITLDIKGVYTATSGNTAEEKEALATHTGGVAGKNEASGIIDHCYIEPNANSRILVGSGMAGGVAGYNKGTIRFSGGETMVKNVMTGLVEPRTDGKEKTVKDMCAVAENIGVRADENWVTWGDNAQVENLKYNDNQRTGVTEKRVQMIMSVNGNLGGITSYNAPTGTVEYCATGNWFLNNKSDAIGVGTGGIIGMNESENDMKFLLNVAFVGRQLPGGKTDRFAGGIIGNQNNTTVSGWKLTDCANYGTVYCYNTHYSGGIIGQWTSSGGTIERCENYGNLQTTHMEPWRGASAGIVAQLYHPYAENEYNVISCGNFGSIYGRAGNSIDNAANDSAGILGNVTTYKADAEYAQRFAIQILDCVNGPGVEIYSGSMASGIVGFLSDDNLNRKENKIEQPSIGNSTANIVLRIERCRNFAKKLRGSSIEFRSGIFGERYGKLGAKNTVLADNYSVVGNNTEYKERPIIAFANEKNGVSFSKEMDTSKNYFFDEVWRYSYQPEVTVMQGETTSSSVKVKGYGENDLVRRASSTHVMLWKDETNDQYFVAVLADEIYVGDWDKWYNCYINPTDGNIYYKDWNGNKNKLGKILFYLPSGAKPYKNTDEVTVAKDPFHTYVREGYRVQEGYTETGGVKQMIAPRAVEAHLQDGKMEVIITPDTNSNLWSQDENGKFPECDPFRYEVTVKVGNETKVSYLYTKTGSVDLPESATGGNVEVTVRACSMYEDVEPSDERKATIDKETRILPTPDIRIEVVEDSSASNTAKCKYELSLNNLGEYNAVAEDGTDLYPGWKVVINYNGKSYTVTKDEPTVEIDGNADNDKAAKQLIAQARPTTQTGDIVLVDSASVSTNIYLPAAFRADASLEPWKGVTPSVKVSGITLEELSIEVTLTGQQWLYVPNPPIYGVDLVGKWKDGKEVVFASADMLVVPDGIVTHTFTGLPEYITQATDLQVRIWFRETGQGPVYTYHEVKTETEANIIYMNGLDANGEPQYSYAQSVVLDKIEEGNDNSSSGWYYRYHYRSSDVITWLDAPVLLNVNNGIGEPPEPQYDEQSNNLQYTFYWDCNPTAVFNNKFKDAKYNVSFTGIDAQGNQVALTVPEPKKVTDIVTGVGNTAWAVTMDAEDWNFTNVKLQVTRIGSSTDVNAQIGLTATGNYKVRQRLEKPGQPAVENVSTDELLYNVSWSSITSETGCVDYEIFAQPYKADGSLDTPVSIATVEAKGDGSQYTKTVDLEAWAGQQLRIFVVAKAAADSQDYVDSATGVTYDMTLPSRITTPTINAWSIGWNRVDPLTQSNFEHGTADSDPTSGLTVALTADDGSIPPGGSVYLLRAYVYDTQEHADAAREDAVAAANKTHTPNTGEGSGYLTGYIISPDGRIVPVQMDALSQLDYNHTLNGLAAAYAGKWIVFQTRISSGDGKVSSEWVTAPQSYQLPFVKLNTVDVTSQNVKRTVTAKIAPNPDVPDELVEKEWTAEQNVFEWYSVPYAEVYYLNVTEKEPEAGSTTPKIHEFRITEETGEDGTPTIVVKEKGNKADGSEGYEWYDATTQRPERPDGMSEADYVEYCKTHKVYLLNGYDIIEFNPDGTVKETHHLGGYQQTLENIHANMAYSVTMTARLEAEKRDGRWYYTLILPDTLSLMDSEGIIVEGSEVKCSAKVTFRADVLQNETDNPVDKSDAYVSSDVKEVDLN